MTVPAQSARPLRVIQVGAGGMGRAWLRTIVASPDVELVGVVDLDMDVARTALAETGAGPAQVGASLTELAAATSADAVVNVTVPAAHSPVNLEALALGLPVLCEKPMAESVAQCLPMIAAAERAGQLLMISQSRRYYSQLASLREVLGGLGPVEVARCDFARAPHFGGFREQMAEPLIVDMAIHQFDLARDLMGADPVSVYCESSNPSWSWYAGNAVATAVFTFAGGSRFAYTGTWCGPYPETSWNGTWQLGASGGGVRWDGDHLPTAYAPDGAPLAVHERKVPEEIAGSLAEFVACLRDGTEPATAGWRNVISVAMVEAAVRSSAEARVVTIAEVMDGARETAFAT
ncbi:Gfo/Idh/MocA family protein [Ruania halotolerans]|uniref:Gfo/Idh/MocA family protein n=1 Tax=Ruania halotolerans TaxID=2897773 RepID=UPI001E5B3538|nr:Gfo/Idh/MocA family oxidoreductase [Ruania halotolerans]UFU07804.1 Gfo/Idh/MocA family oxidoreductase [Ruania halotolerans]